MIFHENAFPYNESLANKDLANRDFSKTLTRSDEKSCTKNLANKDLANRDFSKLSLNLIRITIMFRSMLSIL